MEHGENGFFRSAFEKLTANTSDDGESDSHEEWDTCA